MTVVCGLGSPRKVYWHFYRSCEHCNGHLG